MARRSQAREVAFQILYQEDLNSPGDPAASDELLRTRLGSEDLIEFARGLLAGVRRHRQEMDVLIERTAANWSLHRIAPTDRNVLRLGAYEVLYSDTPDRVAIDEAVELAKRFGSAQSAQFVNGILDRLMHTAAESESTDPPAGNRQAQFEPQTPNPKPQTPNPKSQIPNPNRTHGLTGQVQTGSEEDHPTAEDGHP